MATRRPLRRNIALALLLALVIAPLSAAHAQRLEGSYTPTVVRPPSNWIGLYPTALVPTDSIRIPDTYWLEGGLIGAGVLGFATAILAVGFCNFDSPCTNEPVVAVLGATVGGLTGFGLGALVGGQFPKHRTR